MKRRTWLQLPALAFAAGNSPVDTEEHRAAYLKRMLDELCTKLGPRPSGSKAFEAGIRIALRELKAALPQAELDEVTFRRWIPVGQARLRVAGQNRETYIADNSPGTPKGGVRGTWRAVSGGFEIADAAGRAVARVRVSEFGRAIVTLHSGEDAAPLFNVGRQDVPALNAAAEAKAAAEAEAHVRWIPNVKTHSAVGTLPGDSAEEILIVAHADTKYDTPGANDNTASLITMLMVAHAVSGKRFKHALRFLATTGEELTFFGAKHYAEVRRRAGTLGNVKVCINLDSLTYGPNWQVNTTDAALASTILAIHRDLKIPAQPKVFERDDTMDSAPFLAGGARTVHLNSRGDDARTLPLWHRPEDEAETIEPRFVENSFRVLLELVGRL
ncbi:MAG: M28 family peptidase [Bryobacteraceae bacterium]